MPFFFLTVLEELQNLLQFHSPIQMESWGIEEEYATPESTWNNCGEAELVPGFLRAVLMPAVHL